MVLFDLDPSCVVGGVDEIEELFLEIGIDGGDVLREAFGTVKPVCLGRGDQKLEAAFALANNRVDVFVGQVEISHG